MRAITGILIRLLLLAADAATIAVMVRLHVEGTYEAGIKGAYVALGTAAVQLVLCTAGYAWDKGPWQPYAACHAAGSISFFAAAGFGYLA